MNKLINEQAASAWLAATSPCSKGFYYWVRQHSHPSPPARPSFCHRKRTGHKTGGAWAVEGCTAGDKRQMDCIENAARNTARRHPAKSKATTPISVRATCAALLAHSITILGHVAARMALANAGTNLVLVVDVLLHRARVTLTQPGGLLSCKRRKEHKAQNHGRD